MRITIKDLEGAVDRLNRVSGTPETPYTKTKDGKYKPNPGNFHLSGAYGGYQVMQMCESGGASCPIGAGHVPKRECYETLHAFIKGVEYQERIKQQFIDNYKKRFSTKQPIDQN